MKKFKSKEFEKDCRICGAFNKAPLAIARAVTNKILATETLHTHSNGCEFYFFLRGKAEMQVDSQFVSVQGGDVILIEPGEKHKVSKIIDEIDYISIKTNPDASDKKTH
ncbi:cupin domain-containing protein [Candidatus Woesearchaeota archaeon]|nr:cupin domain-containing protein [Candidatus Woesearchaeota archaeon]